mgnify:CR=1 FL=1
MRLLKKISTLAVIILFAISSGMVAQTSQKSGFKVVLDAGHGGKDSGARGLMSMEKDIVLDVVLQVGHYIKEYQPEIEVIFTRKDDRFIELFERADIANKAEANLFVSIHANASPNKGTYGTETFVMGLHKTESNLEVAQKENAVITLEQDYTEKYEGYDPHSAESYIIFTLMQNIFLDQSLVAADFIQTEFREKARRKDRGVKQAGFLVLWKTTMPSVLVEIGFISNLKEEAYLNSEQGKDYIASAIFRAIRTYYEDHYVANQPDKNIEKNGGAEKNSDKDELNADNEKTNNSDSEIYFSVQLTASTNSADVKASPFNKINEEVIVKKIGNYFKYYAGKIDNYNAAKDLQKSCLDYFPDAFIVAFEGDNPISVAKAISKR